MANKSGEMAKREVVKETPKTILSSEVRERLETLSENVFLVIKQIKSKLIVHGTDYYYFFYY